MVDVLAFEAKGPDRDLGETSEPRSRPAARSCAGLDGAGAYRPSVPTRGFAVPAGSPCHVPAHAGGFSTLSSAQIGERPHRGTAVTSRDGTIHFRTNSGFIGKDYMTVRYRGTGREGPGVRQQATMPLTAATP